MAAKNAIAGAAVAKKPKVLTEEALLKAPEKEYMNDAQLAFFRQQLLELRAQLLNNADDTGQHLRENEVTTDPSDRATLEEEYTLELRTRERDVEVPVGQEDRDGGLGLDRQRLLGQRAVLPQPRHRDVRP